MLYFPGVSEEDFDFEAEWLVRAMDEVQKKILFSGQGENGDLELEVDFRIMQSNLTIFQLESWCHYQEKFCCSCN